MKGINIEGRRFPTLIFVTPSILSPMAKIKTEPTIEVCDMVISVKTGFINPAKRVIDPWYIKMANEENITPIPIVAANITELTPSRIDFAKSIVKL